MENKQLNTKSVVRSFLTITNILTRKRKCALG